ncbi:inner centromere protein [Pelomyxa schiedti]|nr:inner centromere protein [Pelomyxa schiedti]
MARIGETDPRWIVTNREDGTNVGAWHWVEKDCLPWFRETASDAFSASPLLSRGGDFVVTTKSVDVTGEATANNRKGKTIYLYELELTVNWEAKWTDSATSSSETATGTLKMPYIGDDNEGEALEVRIEATGANKSNDKVKKTIVPAMQRECPAVARTTVEQVIARMKEKFATQRKGLTSSGTASAPTPVLIKPAPASPTSTTKPSATSSTASTKSTSSSSPASYVGSGKDLHMTERFRASPKNLYDLLLDPQRLSMLTGGQAIMEPRVGGKFVYFGGAVTGEILELIPEQRIKQTWRFSTWPGSHNSVVTIELSPSKEFDITTLTLHQVGIPSEDLERTQHGWRENFWERIKKMFGYEAPNMSSL